MRRVIPAREQRVGGISPVIAVIKPPAASARIHDANHQEWGVSPHQHAWAADVGGHGAERVATRMVGEYLDPGTCVDGRYCNAPSTLAAVVVSEAP